VSSETPASIDRYYDLLALQATEGLSKPELRELSELQARWPHIDPTEFEIAASALDQALAEIDNAPLSPSLRLLLDKDAKNFTANPNSEIRPSRRFAGKPRVLAWSGWIATAICLGLIFGEQLLPDPSVTEQRERLLAIGAKQYQQQEKDMTALVTWSKFEQRGILEVDGLKPNDSGVGQYQLWIVDAARPDSPPIDAGIFDIHSDGKAIIPFSAKLQVTKPAAFAVTYEQPGGVVVSKGPMLIVVKAS
jgi:anti-sigma-K factor RskA